jgi:anti-anti-sigma regulatory factor
VLRITRLDKNDGIQLKVEGTLRGPWVNELKKVWLTLEDESNAPFLIDLGSVSFVDEEGCALLLQIQEAGVTLEDPSPFLKHILKIGNAKKPKHTRRQK